MTITREMLSAYVDGEVSTEERERVEAALTNDAQMRLYVERQRALRTGLADAFEPLIHEPVPQTLVGRIERTSVHKPHQEATVWSRFIAALNERTTWLWLGPAGAVAAAVVIAVMIGFNGSAGPLIVVSGNSLSASPGLSAVLSTQLASDSEAARETGIHIGLSFVAHDGAFCRTFSGADSERGNIAGIACRTPEMWRVTVVANAEAPSEPGLYRPAGSAMPGIIREAVGDMIAGEPLDASGEEHARAQGWRR